MTATPRRARRLVAVDGDTPLGSGWERTDAIVAARLSDLIAGLDSVGSFAVPYARLPRRLGTYSADFPRWADVAGQTPQDLLARPKLGAAAVQALIEAARAAVRVRRDVVAEGKVGAEAAVTRLIGQLDDYDRALLEAQVWAIDPGPQRVVAKQLGVHPISVMRNLPRARARFAELLADPAHDEVGEHAAELRRRLGPYLPADVARVELRRLGIDPSSQTADTLLHIAGPYARRGQWLESTEVPGGGGAQAAAAVDAVFTAEGAPATGALVRALTMLGIPTGVALTYLETLALRRFGDLWVRWTDDTTANRAEAVLHVLGAPATAETILDTIGAAGGTLDNTNRALSLDDRFIRSTRRTWGLSAWGISEYVGIAHAIGQRIDAYGGRAPVANVIADLTASYPDISETSVRTFMRTLQFVTKGGVVRRRTKADGWPPVPPLKAIRGVFRNGSNEIRVAHHVTSELLRGSGQALHPGVATAAGVTPGEQRAFTSPYGEVILSWHLSSTHGANIGPLLPLATAVEAIRGDTLVLVLRPDHGSIEVIRLSSDDAGLPRLQKLLGRPVPNPAAALSAALNCRREDVGVALRKRGDHELASLLEASEPAPK